MTNGATQFGVNPISVSDAGGVIVMTYDATGLSTVSVCAWPLVAWVFDVSNPINPSPVVIGNPLKTPPSTGAILSPPWAHVVNEFATYVPDTGNGGWRGTFGELMTWLATNNGATRKISGQFTVPPLSNAWKDWVAANKSLIGP